MFRYLAIFFCIAVLSGCKTTPSASTQEAPVAGPVAKPAKPSFELLNRDLSRTIAVNPHVIVQRDGKGLLVFALEMKNVTSSEVIYVQAKTLWFDEKGEKVGEPKWQDLGFIPGQTDFYVKTAPSSEAVDFKVEIRYMAPSSFLTACSEDRS